MANKKTLKGYFETGDIPNQSQYHKLINSNLNLNETGTQTITGSLIVSQSVLLESDLTASGNISASSITGNHVLGGDLTIGDDFTFGIHQLSTHASGLFHLISGSTPILSAQGTHITASGNISSSGEVYAKHYFIENRSMIDYNTSGEILRLGYNNDTNTISIGRTGVTTQLKLNAPVTASIISASGDIIGNKLFADTEIYVGGERTIYRVEGDSTHFGSTDTMFSTVGTHVRLNAPVTASGNISSSGNILANDISSSNLITSLRANIVEQIDMTSTSDSIFNMYMNGVLNTSFHSRGNIDSFVEAGGSTANFGVGTVTPAEKLTVHGNISGSGNLKIDGSQVDFTNLPTSDPSVAGRLYRDGTDLKISLG